MITCSTHHHAPQPAKHSRYLPFVELNVTLNARYVSCHENEAFEGLSELTGLSVKLSGINEYELWDDVGDVQ